MEIAYRIYPLPNGTQYTKEDIGRMLSEAEDMEKEGVADEQNN